MYDDQNANVALLSFSCSTNVLYLQEIGFCHQGWRLGDYKYFLVRGVGDEDPQIGSRSRQICEIHPPQKRSSTAPVNPSSLFVVILPIPFGKVII
jgi:hypothetical protein